MPPHVYCGDGDSKRTGEGEDKGGDKGGDDAACILWQWRWQENGQG